MVTKIMSDVINILDTATKVGVASSINWTQFQPTILSMLFILELASNAGSTGLIKNK